MNTPYVMITNGERAFTLSRRYRLLDNLIGGVAIQRLKALAVKTDGDWYPSFDGQVPLWAPCARFCGSPSGFTAHWLSDDTADRDSIRNAAYNEDEPIEYHFEKWADVKKLIAIEKRGLRNECIAHYRKHYGKTPTIGNSAFVRVYVSHEASDLSFINDYHYGADNLTLTHLKRVVEKMRKKLIHEGNHSGHFRISFEGECGVADSIRDAQWNGYCSEGNHWYLDGVASINI